MLKKRILFLAGILLLVAATVFASETKDHKWEFAVTCIFRDEAEYLKEWIEFHKLVGAEHFYLINHFSKDNYLEVLQPYLKNGEAELINWTEEAPDCLSFGRLQGRAYTHCLKLAQGKVNWMAVLDTDEFLFTRDGTKIQDYLRCINDDPGLQDACGGIYVPWLMFGTSNVKKIPKDKTLIEMLFMTEGDTRKGEWEVKTIFRPDFVKHMSNPHRPRFLKGYKGFDAETSIANNLQLNHYWTRDEDFLWKRKLARKQNWGYEFDKLVQQANGMNIIPNNAIQIFVPELRQRLDLPKGSSMQGK